jgi:DNA-binding HxlR family transcriptional regulator
LVRRLPLATAIRTAVPDLARSVDTIVPAKSDEKHALPEMLADGERPYPIAFYDATNYPHDMERKSFSGMHCSVAQCLEVVGEWWTLLVVRDAFFGVTRFDEFQQRLGISRNILNERLARLTQAGVLTKVPYSEHPPRFDYRLTDKGRDLWPVITSMCQWGDKYAAPDGPPLRLIHRSCGEIADAELICSACGKPIGARDVKAISGPGDHDHLVRAP